MKCSDRTGRLANAAILKKFENIVALGPCANGFYHHVAVLHSENWRHPRHLWFSARKQSHVSLTLSWFTIAGQPPVREHSDTLEKDRRKAKRRHQKPKPNKSSSHRGLSNLAFLEFICIARQFSVGCCLCHESFGVQLLGADFSNRHTLLGS